MEVTVFRLAELPFFVDIFEPTLGSHNHFISAKLPLFLTDTRAHSRPNNFFIARGRGTIPKTNLLGNNSLYFDVYFGRPPLIFRCLRGLLSSKATKGLGFGV